MKRNCGLSGTLMWFAGRGWTRWERCTTAPGKWLPPIRTTTRGLWLEMTPSMTAFIGSNWWGGTYDTTLAKTIPLFNFSCQTSICHFCCLWLGRCKRVALWSWKAKRLVLLCGRIPSAVFRSFHESFMKWNPFTLPRFHYSFLCLCCWIVSFSVLIASCFNYFTSFNKHLSFMFYVDSVHSVPLWCFFLFFGPFTTFHFSFVNFIWWFIYFSLILSMSFHVYSMSLFCY